MIKMTNDEARMSKAYAVQSFGCSHDAGWFLLIPPDLGENQM